MRTPRSPNLCLHKATGRAVVRLNGKDHYLGEYGSRQAREAYERLIAEWLANHRQLVAPGVGSAKGPTVDDVILAYWQHAEQHYRHPDGRPTGETNDLRLSLIPVRELYAELPAAEFSPLKLKAVRQKMIDAGLSRGVVNQRVGRVRRMMKWAAGEELVPPAVLHGLQAVSGLQRGRSAARETSPIKPVPDETFEATLPFLRPDVAAMLRVQRLTGMRPGEVCQMRPRDIDRTGDLWLYTPSSHKTQWRGKERVIAIGPRAQAVLLDFLTGDADAPVFAPARSAERYAAERRAKRVTKLWPSHAGRKRKARPKRRPGNYYIPRTINHAVRRACEKAGVGPWHPNQLRHAAATAIRKAYGVEAAQVVLGHAQADVTQVYAERDSELARKVAAELG